VVSGVTVSGVDATACAHQTMVVTLFPAVVNSLVSDSLTGDSPCGEAG
jgi:hypothetical protein